MIKRQDAGSKAAKSRSYFALTFSLSNPPGLILANGADFLPPGESYLDLGAWDKRGFSGYPKSARPLFHYDRKKGRKPHDLDVMGGYWFITDRTKAVFDAIDPNAFDYMPCDVYYGDQSEPTHAWICDVVRILDAADEEKSDFTIFEGWRGKEYRTLKFSGFVFREEAVGQAHVFRVPFLSLIIVCDDVLRTACRDAMLKGPRFIKQ